MSKNANQKCKLIALMKLLQAETDTEHTLTTDQILEKLRAQGISSERKSLYDDMEALCHMGINVEHKRGKNGGYYIADREFQLPELKLLVDAVQASKFITKKKSSELISKLSSLTSVYESRQLDRQVFVAGRNKTDNEQVYYNVDGLQRAISENRAVTFQYFEWDVQKNKSLRHGGAHYLVSPFALNWDDENYYLIAYDHNAQDIRHFRVDKMLGITVTETARLGQQLFADFDMAVYSKRVFGMFGGIPEIVTLSCDASVVGAVIDRFGEDVTIFPTAEGFEIHPKLVLSPVFFSWILGFAGKIRLSAPQSAIKRLKEHVSRAMASYSSEN